eukprot:1427121-Rhodomonas_salina.1
MSEGRGGACLKNGSVRHRSRAGARSRAGRVLGHGRVTGGYGARSRAGMVLGHGRCERGRTLRTRRNLRTRASLSMRSTLTPRTCRGGESEEEDVKREKSQRERGMAQVAVRRRRLGG